MAAILEFDEFIELYDDAFLVEVRASIRETGGAYDWCQRILRPTSRCSYCGTTGYYKDGQYDQEELTSCHRPKCTIKTETSEGETPLMRVACPSVLGFMAWSFSRASEDRA